MNRFTRTLLCLFMGTLPLSAQDFTRVDAYARTLRKSDYASPEALSLALCKNFSSDQDKARAIFTWIALNIRYDMSLLGKGGAINDYDKKLAQKAYRMGSTEAYEDLLVKHVYNKGKGVCMHFAQLYKKMADEAGLECAYIRGFSKGSIRGGWTSHAWNAVKIQGDWKLLDVTWGAGFADQNGKFHQVFLPGFFFTAPRIFALDHLPAEEKWQLLETPIGKTAFKNQCVFSYGDLENGVQDAEPLEEPLKKASDGKMELRLKIAQAPPVLQLRMGGQDLPFERAEKDEWIILRFRPNRGSELEVWGGTKVRQVTTTALIGVFPVK